MSSKTKRLRFASALSFLAFSPLLLSGCWSSRELNRSALVAGAGFDKEGGKYELSIEILRPLKLIPKARGQSQNVTYVTTETGRTVFETIRTFPHKTTRKLFWSHCEVFVIGHDLANESITQTLDWFYRNQELRPLSFVVLSAGKASDVISTTTPLNPIGSYDAGDTVRTLRDTSDAPSVNLMDFMQKVASPVAAAYMPEIDKIEVVGTGIFLHDRLVGDLNVEESKGLVSLVGQVKSGQLTIPALAGHDQYMTVEIIHAGVKKAVRFTQGKPEVTYHLNYVVDIADDPNEFEHDESTFHEIERRVGEEIIRNADGCIAKLKSYHADVIGTGEEIEHKNPRIWGRLVKNWPEEFPDVPIRVDVRVHLRHEGLIQGSQ